MGRPSRSLRLGAERTVPLAAQGFASSSRVSAFDQPLGPLKRLGGLGAGQDALNRPDVSPSTSVPSGFFAMEGPGMPLYEHVFLARQDVTAQQVETMVETYKGVIEQNGGKVEKIEMWGVKSLAYRIKKNRKAHFTLLNIDAPPAALSEMERQMQISEDVLRFMTVRVEQLESEPSAMMQKRDRDDRKDRERGRRRDEDGFGGGGFGGDRDRGDRPERSFGGEA
jgi:small subunit ribosomal protein S6